MPPVLRIAVFFIFLAIASSIGYEISTQSNSLMEYSVYIYRAALISFGAAFLCGMISLMWEDW